MNLSRRCLESAANWLHPLFQLCSAKYWKLWAVPELEISRQSRVSLFINSIAGYYVFCEASTLAADNEDATMYQLPANCGTFGIPCILFLLAVYWGTTNHQRIVWRRNVNVNNLAESDQRQWVRARPGRSGARASESHVTIISHNVHCQCRPRHPA